ncbi:MAG TPA: class I SAM-dependent methyltransferase [Thermoanaerobaculia bacterium]|nr:class I SAM-dependent methyltransferase [Thermoanaerobaculia bacterium]
MRHRRMFGSELRWLPDFGPLERTVIRFYGTISAPTVIRYARFRHFALAFLDRHGIRPRKVLDFGCAFGAFGFALARRDPEAAVFLHDAAPAAAERCRTIASRGGYSRVKVLDEEGLRRERGFDLILLVAVLEHVEDDRELLARLREKLAPDGHLFVMVPEASGHAGSAADEYHHHVRPGYTRSGLSALVVSAGFEVVAEPVYSPPGGDRLLGRLASAYAFLTRSPGHPLLDFESLPRLAAWKKAGLAVLWPFYRAALERDAAKVGMREDRLALLVRRRRL